MTILRAVNEQRRIAGQPPFVLGECGHHRHPGRGDEGLAQKPDVPAVLLAQQPHFFGEATADLGVAAIGEKLDQNRAVDLQHGEQLVEKAGDHRVPHRSRQADRRAREPGADRLRDGRRLIGSRAQKDLSRAALIGGGASGPDYRVGRKAATSPGLRSILSTSLA